MTYVEKITMRCRRCQKEFPSDAFCGDACRELHATELATLKLKERVLELTDLAEKRGDTILQAVTMLDRAIEKPITNVGKTLANIKAALLG